MKRDYIEFQERSVPLAYLITFRTYGTWLHGDERGSMDRREYNIYGEAKIAASSIMERKDRKLMKASTFLLNTSARRSCVEAAIREVCVVRRYSLFALHVRTNHAHIVASASHKVELMMNAFKAYATRSLRKENLIDETAKVWSRHGSTRYLWTAEHIEAAIDYVVNGQGGELPKFN